MRKYLLATMIAHVCAQASFAQNIAPYWSLSGNSNASASSRLGTTNNTPLRLFTNNAERLRISADGKVGIGTTNPVGKLTAFNNGSAPTTKWVLSGHPVLTTFAEGTGGNGDHILAMASNIVTARPNIIGRRARGILSSPAAVVNNDYLTSLQASGYDGSNFQNGANVDFFVDGTPSAGNVPARISFSTGSNLGNRTERLTIKSNGNVGIGTALPSGKLHVTGRGRFSDGLTVDDGRVFFSHFDIEGEVYEPAVTITGTGETSVALVVNSTNVGSRIIGAQYGLEVSGELGLVANGGYLGIDAYSSRSGGRAIKGYVRNGTAIFALVDSGNGVQAQGDTAVYANGKQYGFRGTGFVGVSAKSESFAGDGVQGIATNQAGWGVNGFSAQDVGVYGGTGNSDSYAGYFQGNVFSTGSYEGSDRLLKQDIKEMAGAMDILKRLKPKSYNYKQEGIYKLMNLPPGRRYGLIAQEVEEVLPGLVKSATFQPAKAAPEKESAPGAPAETIRLKALNYTELIPIMVKGMQEQQNEVEALRQEVKELKEWVARLTQINKNHLSLNSGSLSQSTPNPTNGSTTITYSLPQQSRAAYIAVTDMKGSIIKRINLSNNGSGQVHLNITSLAAGTYTYTLFVDGVKTDSKQLLIAR